MALSAEYSKYRSKSPFLIPLQFLELRTFATSQKRIQYRHPLCPGKVLYACGQPGYPPPFQGFVEVRDDVVLTITGVGTSGERYALPEMFTVRPRKVDRSARYIVGVSHVMKNRM